MDDEALKRLDDKTVSNGRVLLFLPGVVNKREFLHCCCGYGKCAEACPYGSVILVKTEQDLKLPFIDPEINPCYLCQPSPCVEACPECALKQVEPEQVRMGTAQLDPYRCLCFAGEECKVCYDNCPLKGIAIFWDDDVRAPLINMEKCVGCGICLHRCPAPQKPISIVAT